MRLTLQPAAEDHPLTAKPHEAASRRHPERSGRAALELVSNRAGGQKPVPQTPLPGTHPPGTSASPSLNWGVEPFVKIARELPRLFEAHWQELEQDEFGLPLNPDWDLLFDMAQIGRLHVMTARWGKQLVGYIFNFVMPHVYTKHDLQAQIHLFYLHPSYRDEPGFLMQWFRANDEFLVTLGVKKILAMTKNNTKAAVIFKRMGYTPIETVWSRMVP
jgi:hypothetical protein